jgi:hypothetical protein
VPKGKGDLVKNNKKCPKCGGAEIIRVPGSVGGFGAGNNIFVGRTIMSAIEVTRYLCGACGFSDDWIDEAKNIEKVRAKFAGK